MLSLIFSMIAGIRRRSLAMRRDRDGVVAVMMAATLPALVAFAALAIDMSYAYWIRTQLQHAASAAALAGASQLSLSGLAADIVDAVKAETVDYADKNLDPAVHGMTLLAPDVILGNWDPATRTFTRMGTTSGAGTACPDPVNAVDGTNPDDCLPIDAVEATTRRADMNGNPLNLFLGAAVGLAQTDISTVAIAWAEPGPPPPADTDCFQEGMIAGNDVTIQSDNSFINGYCIYGKCEVEIQENTTFEVSHPLLDESGNPILDNDGNPIIVPGTQVVVGPSDPDACEPWAPSSFPGLKLGDELGGENCGLVGLCTPPECGDLSESLAECAWQGALPAEDASADPPVPPAPTPELAQFWADNMFPNIEDLPSMTPPLSTDADLGTITGLDLSAYSTEVQTEMPLPLIFEEGSDETTCQDLQGDVYVVDGDVQISSQKKICNVVIIADKISAGADVTFENVALIAKDSAVGGANIDLSGARYKLNHVLLAAKDGINLGTDGTIGDPESCGGTAPTVQMFAGQNLELQSGSKIFNGDLVAAGNVTLGSEAQVNLTGNGTTIQALGDITVQSNSTFGGCPEDIIADANEEDPEIAVNLRIVQ